MALPPACGRLPGRGPLCANAAAGTWSSTSFRSTPRALRGRRGAGDAGAGPAGAGRRDASRERLAQRAGGGVPGVYPDFPAAGRQAAEHLLELGLRRFACVFYPANRTHQAMEQGFRSVIEAAGRQYQANRADTDQPGATRRPGGAARRCWPTGADVGAPIGVFVAFNGCDARRVSQACVQQGLRIPDDVALVVADDDLPICLQPPPTLTGIDLDYERAGYEAARLLDQLMSGQRRRPSRA